MTKNIFNLFVHGSEKIPQILNDIPCKILLNKKIRNEMQNANEKGNFLLPQIRIHFDKTNAQIDFLSHRPETTFFILTMKFSTSWSVGKCSIAGYGCLFCTG